MKFSKTKTKRENQENENIVGIKSGSKRRKRKHRRNAVKCMHKLRKSRDLKTRFVIRGQGEGSEERGTSARKEKRAKMQLKPMKC